jgi:7-carboxy-7-deazaguanine synthase (Cx14CxxC type)
LSDVTYAVKEIFYTLQGEGANAGRPAVFLRFSGCNLWSGLEKDRDKGPGGCSRWCDTDFVGTNGTNGGKFSTAEQLVAAVAGHWPTQAKNAHPLVVCTGGEPLLQFDASLSLTFRRAGFNVAIETNGTVAPPEGVFWITVSPKAGSVLRIRTGHELKLVYPQPGAEPEHFQSLDFRHFYLQPMDGPAVRENTQAALKYCLAHPQWRLSLQTHKLVGIR